MTVMTGRDVKIVRNALGLTQQRFATLFHLSVVTVNRWERDTCVPTGYGASAIQMLRALPLSRMRLADLFADLYLAPDKTAVVRILARQVEKFEAERAAS